MLQLEWPTPTSTSIRRRPLLGSHPQNRLSLWEKSKVILNKYSTLTGAGFIFVVWKRSDLHRKGPTELLSRRRHIEDWPFAWCVCATRQVIENLLVVSYFSPFGSTPWPSCKANCTPRTGDLDQIGGVLQSVTAAGFVIWLWPIWNACIWETFKRTKDHVISMVASTPRYPWSVDKAPRT